MNRALRLSVFASNFYASLKFNYFKYKSYMSLYALYGSRKIINHKRILLLSELGQLGNILNYKF